MSAQTGKVNPANHPTVNRVNHYNIVRLPDISIDQPLDVLQLIETDNRACMIINGYPFFDIKGIRV